MVVVEVCIEVLQVIQNFIPILGNGRTTEILSAISPLYILAELDMRLRVCNLLDALVASDASLLSVVNFTLFSFLLLTELYYILYFCNISLLF